MPEKFTAPAKAHWEAIPAHIQELLLNNVWCPHCASVTTITDFSGRIEAGDLILSGSCVTCGKNVARVIEGE